MDEHPWRYRLAAALIALGTLMWALGIDDVGPASTYVGAALAVILLVRLYRAAVGSLSDELRHTINRVALGFMCAGVLVFLVASGLVGANPFGLAMTMVAGFGLIWVLIGAHPIN